MKHPLYRRVAERVAEAVRVGTYRRGDRLPSVRILARDWQVGINTAIEAYRSLTAEGIIESRPHSGFYVIAERPVPPTSIQVPPALAEPTAVTTGELALRILTDSRRPGILALGAALPDPDKLPLAALRRALREVMRSAPQAAFAYAMVPGTPEFCTAVARHWLAAGCRLRPDEVVATDGGLEAMVLALRATCPAGAVVAVESPTYYGVLQALEGLGLRALEIPSTAEHGMDLGALRFALAEHPVAAVLAISNFCNPSGSRMPDGAKIAVAGLCRERQIPLIEDDIYGDLAHDGTRPSVAKSAAPEDVILCSSFSKTVAPGLRVGFAAGGRWTEEIKRLKACSSISAPTLGQLAVARLLVSGALDRHLRRVRPLYGRSCQAMAQAVLAAFPVGTRVSRPAGGYLLWVELPPTVDAVRLYDIALRAGISIAPGPLFSARGRYAHCFRLTAASWEDRRREAIATLGRLAVKLDR